MKARAIVGKRLKKKKKQKKIQKKYYLLWEWVEDALDRLV